MTPRTHITAVALDAYGTLCDLRVRRASYRRLALALGLPSRVLWRRALTGPTGLDMAPAVDAAALAAAAEALRAEIDSFFVYPDTLPVLAALRQRGVPTAVVSNVSTPYAAKLREAFEAHTDHLVLSCEVGVAKPDPAIFALALDRLDRAPHEVLMVGDSPSSDVAGARAVGMHARRIARDGAPVRGVLTDLTQVLALLAG